MMLPPFKVKLTQETHTHKTHYNGVKHLVTAGKLVDGGMFPTSSPSFNGRKEACLCLFALKFRISSNSCDARGTGAILESHPDETKEAQIKGSMIVYTAENVEEVRELIEKDVYATSGVWDLERVSILPVSLCICSLD
jgi:hypothetical protein